MILIFVCFLQTFVARTKQTFASIYHCGSRLRIKKVPASKRLPQCAMWPYYRVFYDFACLNFLNEILKFIYHYVSHAGSRHRSDWHAVPCRRTLEYSIWFWCLSAFCKLCRSNKANILPVRVHLPLRFATTDKKGAGSEASSTMRHVAVLYGISWFYMFDCI